jgi:hypothetical protein
MPTRAPKHEAEPAVDEAPAETATGHIGETPDPTPNENYTVAGVSAGKPTPETDAGLAAAARTALGQG